MGFNVLNLSSNSNDSFFFLIIHPAFIKGYIKQNIYYTHN